MGRRLCAAVRTPTILSTGLFWKAMQKTQYLNDTNFTTLLDSGAWEAGGGLATKKSAAITCQQLILAHHPGRGGPLIADDATRAVVQTITNNIFLLSGQTECPACGDPLYQHTKGEIFMNALQSGLALKFHTDEPPPPSTGSACETSIIVLLHPASEGGVLRVSRMADGTATRADVSGGHPFRDTDALPLEAPGDTAWIHGMVAAHKVTAIRAGTRVSLCIGVMCPSWHTLDARARPTVQGEGATDVAHPT